MKKISTVAAKQNRNFTEQKLTIGFDLGDRSSWYCVLDEMGNVLLEQRLSTTPKAMQEVFGAMPRSRIALETGMHSPWVSRLLSGLGHEVIVAGCPRFAPVLWALTWDHSLPLHFRGQISKVSAPKPGVVGDLPTAMLVTRVREPSHRVFLRMLLRLFGNISYTPRPIPQDSRPKKLTRAHNSILDFHGSPPKVAGPSSTGFQLEELCLERSPFFISVVWFLCSGSRLRVGRTDNSDRQRNIRRAVGMLRRSPLPI